jgi:hypothetical protein
VGTTATVFRVARSIKETVLSDLFRTSKVPESFALAADARKMTNESAKKFRTEFIKWSLLELAVMIKKPPAV